MRGLTDFLIEFHIAKRLCGRGPALFGLLVTLAIPVGVLLVLTGAVYPGGLTSFASKAAQVLLY